MTSVKIWNFLIAHRRIYIPRDFQDSGEHFFQIFTLINISEILGVARKCVPDPKVDPEIEALLNSLDIFSSEIVSLKSSASSLYEGGFLDIQTSIKFEVRIHQ